MAQRSYSTLTALGLLTVTTGLIDAATVLGFTVFAANMTGNVVFIGFSLGGSPDYSLIPSLAALIGFLVGSWTAGFVVPDRLMPRPAGTALGLQSVLVGVAALTAALTAGGAQWQTWVLMAVLGAAMGLQNVISLASPVPDMKTTVLTLTLAGFAADLARGKKQKWNLRLTSVILLLSGALGGTLIFLSFGMGWTLLAATVTTALAAVILRNCHTDQRWQIQPAR